MGVIMIIIIIIIIIIITIIIQILLILNLKMLIFMKMILKLFLWLSTINLNNAKHIRKEIMPVAWHTTRWWDWCMPQDEKNE